MDMHIDGELLIKIGSISKGAVTLVIALRSNYAPHETVHEWTQTLHEYEEFRLAPMKVRVGVTLGAS